MSKTKLSDDDLFLKIFEKIPEGRAQTDIQETVLCGALIRKHSIVVSIVQGLKSLLNCLKPILEKGLAPLRWMIFFGAKPSTIKNHLFLSAFKKEHRHAYCCRKLLKPMPRSIQDAAFPATKSLRQDLKTMFYRRTLTSIDLGV